MKSPFLFAKELIRYCRGELPTDEEQGMERVLSEAEGLAGLAEELKDKARIEQELRVMTKFDVEKALKAVGSRRRARRLRVVSWSAAAAVVFMVGFFALFLQREPVDMSDLAFAERTEPGKAMVTLEMASGLTYRLDTMSSIVRNNGAEVAFDNEEGVLRVKEQVVDMPENAEEEGMNTINVPYGGTYTVELYDGTRVYLNSGTVLKFPSRFVGQQRVVHLKGEAYFEVVRDASKPFVVEVNEMSVKVLGTSFNVKSYVDEPGVYTTLVEGSVSIVRDGQPEKLIKPGEQAYYNKGVGTLSVVRVNVAEFTAWKEGLFYFNNITLDEILRIVARWYDLNVFYMNASAKSVVYSGKMPMYSSVEDVLRKFEISGDVRFELKDRTLTVFDK